MKTKRFLFLKNPINFMLRTRTRFRILLVVLVSAGLALSTVLIARALNLGTNIQDPLYFDSLTHSRFRYDNGTQVLDLDFDSYPVDDTRAICNVSLDGTVVASFNVTPDGRYIDPVGGATNNYTIFWVHIVESGSAGSESTVHIGNTHSIFDPVGILGAANTEYNLTITANYVYWAEEPPLHGAQFSLIFEVRDSAGVKVAEGEMDFTCGMLFQLDVGAGNFKTLELIDTNYDISRNRLSGWYPALIFAIATPIVVFCFLHFYKKKPLGENIEITFLVAAGESAFLIDVMVDVWMYAPLFLIGNLILHSAVTGAIAAYTYWKKIGLKWIIPSVLEIAFVGVMVTVTGDAYVPHLTAFMGLTISFLCILWVSGYKRAESTTKLGKLFSEFV